VKAVRSPTALAYGLTKKKKPKRKQPKVDRFIQVATVAAWLALGLA
jgi:hypothetical protein